MNEFPLSPAWSPIALCRIGLPHSLHFTIPYSDRSGSAPKIFMCRASSHCVGGDGGGSVGDETVGEAGRLSHEKGTAAGAGATSGLSLSVIVMFMSQGGFGPEEVKCEPRYTSLRVAMHWLTRDAPHPYVRNSAKFGRKTDHFL